jgi:hypothetical protein
MPYAMYSICIKLDDIEETAHVISPIESAPSNALSTILSPAL